MSREGQTYRGDPTSLASRTWTSPIQWTGLSVVSTLSLGPDTYGDEVTVTGPTAVTINVRRVEVYEGLGEVARTNTLCLYVCLDGKDDHRGTPISYLHQTPEQGSGTERRGEKTIRGSGSSRKLRGVRRGWQLALETGTHHRGVCYCRRQPRVEDDWYHRSTGSIEYQSSCVLFFGKRDGGPVPTSLDVFLRRIVKRRRDFTYNLLASVILFDYSVGTSYH